MMFILFISFALAQDNNDEIRYEKETEIDFEDLEIEGALVKPQGALLIDRQTATFNPLIKLRTDFNPEISTSVSEVK
jgi:hypothetical protein